MTFAIELHAALLNMKDERAEEIARRWLKQLPSDHSMVAPLKSIQGCHATDDDFRALTRALEASGLLDPEALM